MHGEIDEIVPAFGMRYGVDPSAARPEIMDAWYRALTDSKADDAFWGVMSKTYHRSPDELLADVIAYPRITKDVSLLLPKLQGTFHVSMLSNQIRSWHVPFMQARGLNPFFSTIVTSYDVGIAKPNERIYQELLSRCNADPRACLFIDDRAENIQTARHLGMQTIHLIEPERLGDELRMHSVDF